MLTAVETDMLYARLPWRPGTRWVARAGKVIFSVPSDTEDDAKGVLSESAQADFVTLSARATQWVPGRQGKQASTIALSYTNGLPTSPAATAR